MISQFASDPALVLLLKLLVAYTTFVTRGKKDTENAIITRGDSSEMLADDAYFGSITLQAQEVGSLGTVSLANVAHSAFSLGLVFTRISLSYFVSNADSVAAVQLLVYVGAINVLIVFAVMVTNKPTQSGRFSSLCKPFFSTS